MEFRERTYLQGRVAAALVNIQNMTRHKIQRMEWMNNQNNDEVKDE